MKANELMFGDWVYCEGQPTPDNVIIQSIHEDGVWFQGEEFEGAASYDRIFPIPITPEILEKNGFKDVSNHTLKGCNTYELSFGRDYNQKIIYKLGDYFAYESYDDRWYRLFETQICHKWCVHHLQHALRLCGIDKEIEL